MLYSGKWCSRLLHQHHLLGFLEIARCQTIEVDTGRQIVTITIARVPGDLVCPDLLIAEVDIEDVPSIVDRFVKGEGIDRVEAR